MLCTVYSVHQFQRKQTQSHEAHVVLGHSAHDVSFVNERDLMAFRLVGTTCINLIRTIIRLHDKAMKVEIQKDDLIFVNPFDDFMLIIIQLNFISLFIRYTKYSAACLARIRILFNISCIQRRYDVGMATYFENRMGKNYHKNRWHLFSFYFWNFAPEYGAFVLILYTYMNII